MDKMKTRNANFELLRIIAMLMVLSLHYMGKGGALGVIGGLTPNGVFAYVIEELCYVAVNVFILISGYFLVSANFRMEKLIKLWLQIFFYSALIYLIFILFGNVDSLYKTKYFLGQALMPITHQEYWFLTSYFVLYLLSPFLGLLARKLKKEQLLTLCIVMLLFFSRVWKILLPQSDPIDDRGYGYIWFVTLFFIGCYIRLYGKEDAKKWKYLIGYFVFVAINFSLMFGISFVSKITGRFEQFTFVFNEYNAPFTILASISLFLFFKNLRIEDGKTSKVICRISKSALAVYIIHEQFMLRGLWTSFWHVDYHFTKFYFLLHYIVCITAIFAICIGIETLRDRLFNVIYRTKAVTKFFEFVSRVDRFFPRVDQ